jgi:hypothetical protein
MSQARKLFAKVWDEHIANKLTPNVELLHVDRHLLRALGSCQQRCSPKVETQAAFWMV